jgi:hypothetical protein
MAVGTLAMGIQYSSTPKYPIFTGFLVTEDSPRMTVLFGLHDIGFLFSAWIFYGPVICLSSIFGRQISLTLDFMTDELKTLVRDPTNFIVHQPKQKIQGKLFYRDIDTAESESSVQPYSIETLLMDYKKMMMYMDRLNEFCSYKFLFIHITAYIQMIGDVFIMIQILRAGGQFWDIFFYIEDCGVNF